MRTTMRTMARLAVLPLLATGATALATPAGESLAANVDKAVDAALTENRLVGAVVLISRDGQLVYERAAGFADREANRRMETGTMFRLSSVSKPITSAAVLALAERRRLSLDDAVTKWLPTFRPRLPNGNAPTITLRQLLTHTSGLGYKFIEKPGSPYHTAAISDGFDELRIDLPENLRRISSVPLFNAPGETFRYSVSMDVLGAVIEQVTGKRLPAAVAELVTRPLRMKDTSFLATAASRLAAPYYDAEPIPARMSDPQIVPTVEGGQLIYSPSRIFDATVFPSAGAGMVGTAPDLMLFLEAVRKGGEPILSAATAASMMRNHTGSLPGQQPGFGFGFGGSVLVDPIAAKTPQSAGTWTWGGVYGHFWFVDPARGLTVIAFTNTALEGMWGKFTIDLRDAVYEALGAAPSS